MQTRVPFGQCSVVCDGFVGCRVSSYLLVGWMSRSGLIGVMENVKLVDLHRFFVIGFTGGLFFCPRVAFAFFVYMPAVRRV